LISEIRMVERFHNAFGLPVAEKPTAGLSNELVALRVRLLQEELDEYRAAAESRDLTGVADALTDLAYVLFGTIAAHGMTSCADQLFAEVHRSNMSKLDADGHPIYRSDGKVLKSSQYDPPHLEPLLSIAQNGRMSEEVIR
jgi:predicted HAD superfamily Cof-like phosphohydrolase